MINFCLDINCNVNDDGILPRNVCATCLEKLLTAFELKTNGRKSDKYLMEILKSAKFHDTPIHEQSHYYMKDDHDDLLEPLIVSHEKNSTEGHQGAKSAGNTYACATCGKSFTYFKAYNKHLMLHRKHEDLDEEEDHRSFQWPDDNIEESDDSEFSPKGERHRNHVCRICRKIFKYQKPYKNHMKMHNATENQDKNRIIVSKPTHALLIRAPSDSKSSHGSPPYLDYWSDHEPDFSLMMVNSSVRNGDDGESSSKRQRTRKQIFPSGLSSLEANPEINISEPEGQDSSDEKEHLDLADFSEVDVKSMLESKPISFADDSVSQLTLTTSSRSRSASVEVIHEFDLFRSSISRDN